MTNKDTINSLEFSYFEPPIKQPEKRPDEVYNIGETYTDIRSGALKAITDKYRTATTKAEREVLKQTKFPFVTFSGTFSTRSIEGLLSRSGFLCVDIDHLGNRLRAVWGSILASITPALMFISPSGDGIKVVLWIDVNGPHLSYFLAFQRFFINHFDIEIDKACKDISRACFLGHDPEAYMSENPTLFDQSFIDSMAEMRSPEPLPHTPQFTPQEPEQETDRKPMDSATPLDIAAYMVRGARGGEKHEVLLKASRLLGGYVASHEIERAEAVKVLEDEIGKKDIVSFPDAQKTIQAGLNYGASDPLKISPPPDQGSGGKASTFLSSEQEPQPEAEQKHKPEKQGKAPFDPAEALKRYKIDPLADISEPPVILSINGWPIATLGNFSLLIGKAKSRKTFLMTALIAAAASGKCSISGIVGTIRADNVILYFDTEQSPFHVNRTIKRICKQIGIEAPENLLAFGLRPLSPKERLAVIDHAINNTSGIAMVGIDGIADLLSHGNNDEEEAIELTSKLLKWTQDFNIHIITALHQNKAASDTNATGHIGSALTKKAESVISVTKDAKAQNISIVKAEFCRDIEFVPFTFVIDDDGLPMLGDNPEPISNMSVSMIENFEYLFQARIEIRYTQLFREYQEMTGLGERSAKKHIGIALKNGILSKNNNGNYMLARNNISDEDMGPFKTLG